MTLTNDHHLETLDLTTRHALRSAQCFNIRIIDPQDHTVFRSVWGGELLQVP